MIPAFFVSLLSPLVFSRTGCLSKSFWPSPVLIRKSWGPTLSKYFFCDLDLTPPSLPPPPLISPSISGFGKDVNQIADLSALSFFPCFPSLCCFFPPFLDRIAFELWVGLLIPSLGANAPPLSPSLVLLIPHHIRTAPVVCSLFSPQNFQCPHFPSGSLVTDPRAAGDRAPMANDSPISKGL